jgi:hypothetical protein
LLVIVIIQPDGRRVLKKKKSDLKGYQKEGVDAA